MTRGTFGSFKYYSSETMFNKDGGEIHPGLCYLVGGNTKVYGAALFRLREKDRRTADRRTNAPDSANSSSRNDCNGTTIARTF